MEAFLLTLILDFIHGSISLPLCFARVPLGPHVPFLPLPCPVLFHSIWLERWCSLQLLSFLGVSNTKGCVVVNFSTRLSSHSCHFYGVPQAETLSVHFIIPVHKHRVSDLIHWVQLPSVTYPTGCSLLFDSCCKPGWVGQCRSRDAKNPCCQGTCIAKDQASYCTLLATCHFCFVHSTIFLAVLTVTYGI